MFAGLADCLTHWRCLCDELDRIRRGVAPPPNAHMLRWCLHRERREPLSDIGATKPVFNSSIEIEPRGSSECLGERESCFLPTGATPNTGLHILCRTGIVAQQIRYPTTVASFQLDNDIIVFDLGHMKLPIYKISVTTSASCSEAMIPLRGEVSQGFYIAFEQSHL